MTDITPIKAKKETFAMLGVGTNIYSVVFIGVALIMLIGAATYLIRTWSQYGKNVQLAMDKNEPVPTWITPAIKTIVVAVIYIAAFTLGWNAMQSITTTMSSYKSPAEMVEQKKVQELELPATEDLDKVRVDQKKRAEIKPHQGALESFDEAMKQEAEKIKQRSLGSSKPAAEK